MHLYKCKILDAPSTTAELDTLHALIEHGPLDDGDVPSKSGRDSLIEKGLAVRIVQRGEDGYTAATYKGREAYRARYLGDEFGTIAEAKAARLAQRAIVRARGN